MRHDVMNEQDTLKLVELDDALLDIIKYFDIYTYYLMYYFITTMTANLSYY